MMLQTLHARRISMSFSYGWQQYSSKACCPLPTRKWNECRTINQEKSTKPGLIDLRRLQLFSENSLTAKCKVTAFFAIMHLNNAPKISKVAVA